MRFSLLHVLIVYIGNCNMQACMQAVICLLRLVSLVEYSVATPVIVKL